MSLSSDILVTTDGFFSRRVTKSEGLSVKILKVGNGFGVGSVTFLESEKGVL